MACAVRVRDFPAHHPYGIGSTESGQNCKSAEVLHINLEAIVLRVGHGDRSRVNHKVWTGGGGGFIWGGKNIRGGWAPPSGRGGARVPAPPPAASAGRRATL